MTAKGNHSTPAKPVVLFGLDSAGKPKAARFSKEHAGLAVKAASQLALQVLAGNDPKLAEIAAHCRWVACMRPAEPSCPSLVATCTTWWLRRPRTAICISRQARRPPVEQAAMLPARCYR